MRLYEENRKLMNGIAVAALSVMAAWVIPIRWIGSDIRRLDGEYSVSRDRLIRNREGPYESTAAIQSVKSANTSLARMVEELSQQVEIPFHEWTLIPSEYSKDPGAYFRMTHARQQMELGIEGSKAGNQVEIVDVSLGFKDILDKGLLQDAEAQENLHRLSIVRRLVLLLIDAGVSRIVRITPDTPVMTGSGDVRFVKEYAVRIEVRTQIDPLMKFLHAVRRPGEFFLVIRELDVRASDPYERGRVRTSDDEDLTVVISAAGMRFPEKGTAAPAAPGPMRAPARYEPSRPRGH